MSTVKVLLVDDHEVIRDGLKAVLEKDARFTVVSEAPNGQEALDKIPQFNPDIIILDISMPILNGMETAKKINELYPGMKVIMLSMHHESSYITQCMDYNIMGYILKDEGGKEVLKALEAVQSGKKYYSDLTTKVIFEKFTQERSTAVQSKPKNIALTNREFEIMQQIAKGLTNHQIADSLFISFRTVETHRANLMKKLEAKNSIELINKARNNGIIG